MVVVHIYGQAELIPNNLVGISTNTVFVDVDVDPNVRMTASPASRPVMVASIYQ